MVPSPRELVSIAHRRIHSPSLSDLWLPSSRAPLPESPVIQSSPAIRPSLGSLDLASPPTKSALPLTPPLTPASTRPEDESDISDARSSRSNSFHDVAQFNAYAHEYPQLSQWSPPDATFQMHKPPVSDAALFRNVPLSYASVLPSTPTSPTHPKHSPAQCVRELDSSEVDSQPASRFLYISGIPNTASSHTLKQAFVGCGDLKGIFVRFQAKHGVIILAFFDIRHTMRAHRQISTRTFFAGARLVSRYIYPNELRRLIGQSNFVNQNDGDLFVTTTYLGSEGELDAAALQNNLASLGDLRSFSVADSSVRAFHVEYFDARDASSAINALQGRVILGVRLHLTLRDASADSTSEAHSRSGINTNVALATGIKIGTGMSVSDEQIPFPHVESPTSPTPTNPGGLPIPSVSHSSAEPFDRPGSSHGHAPALERRLSVDSLLHGLRLGGLHHSVSEQNLRMRAKAEVAHPFPHAHIPHLSAQVESQHPEAHFSSASGTDAAMVHAYTDLDTHADAKTPTTARPSRVKTPPQYIHARRISNIYHFDSVGKVPIPRMAPRPRSISVASDTGSPIAGRGLVLEAEGPGMSGVSPANPEGGEGGMESAAGRVGTLEGSVMGSPGGMGMGLGLEASPAEAARVVTLPPYQGPLPVPVVSAGEEDAHWPRERGGSVSASTAASADTGGSYSPEQYFIAVAQQHQQQQTYQTQQALHQAHQSTTQLPTSVSTRRQLGLGGLGSRRAHGHGHGNAYGHGSLSLEMSSERERERETPPERNRIDIAKIERGEETRTTVMIKNIPNKMSDRHLIDFINDVCPRKVDFLYLRMDFTNGCNVGYAFVNFIQVEDLLLFAKTKLGTKWNLFSSEKVLGMSYANYQGKEALIDKFRSSSIMDQREAWRPKLFHSYGPKKGLPEDFPAPTHMRRKERSSLLPSELHQNRALFHHSQGMRG